VAHTYMKTQHLHTNKTKQYLGKENAWEAGGVRYIVGVT